ncbi:MAG: O-acetylhomoserine aminocarboxypropyltransferase/cysteine synthase [Glaciihabitans sp.]|nr:O-acetylhomoserine aminocarboxypropyltransferase/cysteine synthase [Glaciihabitans sp.]
MTSNTTYLPATDGLPGEDTAPQSGVDEASATASPRVLGFSTRQVHAADTPDLTHGARINPVYLSAGFLFEDFDEAEQRFSGEGGGYVYSRINNPTNIAVEKLLADLEGGAGATLVASGQAASTVAVLGIVKAGDHVLSAPSIYEGTRALFRHNFARLGIEVEFVEHPNDPQDWLRRVRPNTRLFFGEVIPNPKNDLIDLAAIADAAHEARVPFVVDSTLATPYLIRPIEHGVDVVIHSTSKFLAGHGNAIGGVVIDAGRFDWAAEAERYPHLAAPAAGQEGPSLIEKFGKLAGFAYTRGAIASRFGPSLSPFNAFLLQQGIETLSLRIERHVASALAIARWLELQPEVSSVDYSGLPSHPQHELALRYFPRGQGSVFAFTLRGGREAARTVIDAVEIFSRMTHVGDVRSLILHPPTTTHSKLSAAERERAGIFDGLVRLSVGIEDADDLIADLDRAFRILRGEDLPSLLAGTAAAYTPAEGL